jgi:hypothetical protein
MGGAMTQAGDRQGCKAVMVFIIFYLLYIKLIPSHVPQFMSASSGRAGTPGKHDFCSPHPFPPAPHP